MVVESLAPNYTKYRNEELASVEEEKMADKLLIKDQNQSNQPLRLKEQSKGNDQILIRNSSSERSRRVNQNQSAKDRLGGLEQARLANTGKL